MTKEEKSEEEAHALALKRDAAAGLFTEPSWPASRVLMWIAFRELTRIGDDWCSDLHKATWYTTRGAQAPVDTNPRRTLLHALQEGKVRAIRDGEAKPPEAWFGATERNFLAMDFMLRRSDVLDLWLEKKANGADAKPSDDDARVVIRAAMARDNGFIGQKAGAGIVLEKYPGFNKTRAMALVRGLTQNTKPGPRGPRKNCPDKIIVPDN